MNGNFSKQEVILIVDDNPANLEVLFNFLDEAGFEVRVARDGESAIRIIEYEPPDLILLDVIMPVMDGFETCYRLKVKPSTQDIPVIFMTAISDTVEKVKGLSLGAVDYITKPFQHAEVLARVRLHLKLRNFTQQLQDKNEQLQLALQQLQAAQKQIIAQEKLASLGSLTAGIAHEIKNPLNFVNNFAAVSVELIQELHFSVEHLLEYSKPEAVEAIKEIMNDLRENMNEINRQGQRANSIVQNMLLHTRREAGQLQLTDLNTLVAEALQLVYHSWQAKSNTFNISIETDYDAAVGRVNVVPSALSRALLNLIDNACYAVAAKKKKMGEEFTPQLAVKTRNLGEQLEVRIQDNGDGVPQEMLEKIFHPFFTTKPPGDGTGLGLSIAHEIIVGQHRGQIKVETAAGTYTEIIILLPIV